MYTRLFFLQFEFELFIFYFTLIIYVAQNCVFPLLYGSRKLIFFSCVLTLLWVTLKLKSQREKRRKKYVILSSRRRRDTTDAAPCLIDGLWDRPARALALDIPPIKPPYWNERGKRKGNLFEEKSFIFFLKPNIYCLQSIFFFIFYFFLKSMMIELNQQDSFRFS